MMPKVSSGGVRKAVFPAAGLGTRFLPATKAVPKEMLPLIDKPLIQYAVEEVKNAGIRDICIVTGRGKAAIEDHFDVSFELEHLLRNRKEDGLLSSIQAIADLLDISYVRQKEALGLGHAVLRARAFVGSEPFAVLLADDVIVSEVPCIRQLLDAFDQLGDPVIALMEVPADSVSLYGIVAATPVATPRTGPPLYRISELIEKPEPTKAPSTLAIIGRYVLTPDIFDVLSTVAPGRSNEIQLTDGLGVLCRQRPVYGVHFEGTRYDAGDKLGLLMASIELALHRNDLKQTLAQYLSKLNGGDLVAAASGRSLPAG